MDCMAYMYEKLVGRTGAIGNQADRSDRQAGQIGGHRYNKHIRQTFRTYRQDRPVVQIGMKDRLCLQVNGQRQSDKHIQPTSMMNTKGRDICMTGRCEGNVG